MQHEPVQGVFVEREDGQGGRQRRQRPDRRLRRTQGDRPARAGHGEGGIEQHRRIGGVGKGQLAKGHATQVVRPGLAAAEKQRKHPIRRHSAPIRLSRPSYSPAAPGLNTQSAGARTRVRRLP